MNHLNGISANSYLKTIASNTGLSADENLTNTTSLLNVRAASTLAASATYQGTSEDVSKWSRIGVAIKSDNATDGTLWFEVSHNNSTWSTIPRAFANTSIANPHMWLVVEKYFRIRYVNGTTEADNLSIQVHFSTDGNIALGHQLNGTLIDETESQIVRSINVGNRPDGSYNNANLSGSAFSTTAVLANGATYDSGILNMTPYQQVQTEILASHNGSLIFTFYSDSAGSDNIRSLTIPYTASNGFQFFGAPTFGYYVRYQFLNNSGSLQTDFYFSTKFGITSINGQMISLTGNLAASMIANVGRNVIVGQKDDASFSNVGLSDEGELFSTTLASNRRQRALYTSGTISGDTYAILVDLSSEAFNNYANIDNISMSIDLLANNANCIVKIGVITRIDGTDADIDYLISSNFSASSANTYLNYIDNFQPSTIQFRSSGGSLVNASSNDNATSVTAVHTGLTLTSPKGTVTPAVNDIIIFFDFISGNFTCIVSAVYHAD